MTALLRHLIFALVRLYYPYRSAAGLDRLPTGAAIFVANHPNGLLDPMLLRLALGREVAFLAKSTLFGNPIGKMTMRAFSALPVYRPRDGADTKNNEATFAACRARLTSGGDLALFPEGTSHSDPSLKPLKTGVARIALTTHLPSLVIVPVGLSYEDKVVFRSRVHAVVGAPIEVAAYRARYQEDPEQTVRALTEDVRDALASVTTQAETRELLEGIERLSVLTAKDAHEAQDPAHRHERSQKLLAAYKRLRQNAPERLTELEREARRYLRAVSALRIRDPWALETDETPLLPLVTRACGLVALLPAACAGALLTYLPYRLAGVVARRVSDEEDLHGTLKLLAGMAFLTLAWAVETTVAGFLFGQATALLVLVGAPVFGYVALRFGESAARLRETVRYLFVRERHRKLAAALRERRQTLAERIEVALSESVREPVS